MFNIYYVQTMLFIHYCVNTFVLKILCDFAVFAVNRYSSKVNLGVKVIKLLFFLVIDYCCCEWVFQQSQPGGVLVTV